MTLLRTALGSTLTAAILAMTSATLAGATPSPDGTAHAGTTSGAAVAAAPPGYSVTGIDVSGHQPGVNWSTVAAAGTSFAYSKATEGNGYISPEFSQQYNGAKNVGLFAGAYDYARPDKKTGTAEADFFLDHAGYVNDGRTLPPMLDIEWPYKDSSGNYVAPYPCYGLSTSAMSAWIRAFVTEVHARTGTKTLIYTNTNWWNQCTGSNATFGDQLLFVARYSSTPGTLPPGFSNWTFWQYSDSGSLPGDQDVFNGTHAQLAALAGGSTGSDTVAWVTREGGLQIHAGDGPYAGGFMIDTTPNADEVLVAGDWNGDGKDTVAWVTREGGLQIHGGDGPYAGGLMIDATPNADEVLVAGDWNGDGKDTVAWVTREGGLQIHAGDGPYAGGFMIDTTPNADEVLVAGDWNGDGKDTVAWVTAQGGLQIHAGDGPYAGGVMIDATPNADEVLVAGDWNGDGNDTVAWVTREGGLQIHGSDGPYAGGLMIDSTPNADEVLVAGDWDGV